MIHQNTNSDHAMGVIEFITAEKNVKRNIGRGIIMDTRRHATNKLKNIKNELQKITAASIKFSKF